MQTPPPILAAAKRSFPSFATVGVSALGGAALLWFYGEVQDERRVARSRAEAEREKFEADHAIRLRQIQDLIYLQPPSVQQRLKEVQDARYRDVGNDPRSRASWSYQYHNVWAHVPNPNPAVK